MAFDSWGPPVLPEAVATGNDAAASTADSGVGGVGAACRTMHAEQPSASATTPVETHLTPEVSARFAVVRTARQRQSDRFVLTAGIDSMARYATKSVARRQGRASRST